MRPWFVCFFPLYLKLSGFIISQLLNMGQELIFKVCGLVPLRRGEGEFYPQHQAMLPWTYKLHLDKCLNEHRIDTYIQLVNWCFRFSFDFWKWKGMLLRGNHQESHTTNLPLVDTFSWEDMFFRTSSYHSPIRDMLFEFEPFTNKAEIRSFCYSSPEQTSIPSPINVAWKHHPYHLIMTQEHKSEEQNKTLKKNNKGGFTLFRLAFYLHYITTHFGSGKQNAIYVDLTTVDNPHERLSPP